MRTLLEPRPHENVEDAFALIAAHRKSAEIDYSKSDLHPSEMLIVASVDANDRGVLCFCYRDLDTLPRIDQVVPVYHRMIVDRTAAAEGIQNLNFWDQDNYEPSIFKVISKLAFDQLAEVIREGKGEMYCPTMSRMGSTIAFRILTRIARDS